MKPAPERLEADHSHIARAHQRLEISLDIAVLDRGPKLFAEHHAALARTAELFSEVPATASSLCLGVIEREISVLQQIFGIVGVFGKDRDTDGSAGAQRLHAYLDRAVEQPTQLLAD